MGKIKTYLIENKYLGLKYDLKTFYHIESDLFYLHQTKKTKRTLLSIRELECLQLIAKGLNNHEAAHVLNVSKATLRTHLEHVYHKLDVTNRVEAIIEAIRQGIIDL